MTADKRGSGDMTKYDHAPFKKEGDEGFRPGPFKPRSGEAPGEQLPGGPKSKKENEGRVG